MPMAHARQSSSPHGTLLFTDLYQLTMAQGYWKAGMADDEAVFHLVFRRSPFEGGFAVAAGLADAIDFLTRLQPTKDDLAYLASFRGNDDKPLFDPGFLDELKRFAFACDIDAVPEGTVVFPQEPILRIRGPIIHAQLVESALLNIINFQTLIATKAARLCQSAGNDPVIEFGLRRAQGPDGALSASRASFIGGCAATSNVLAGRLFGIPVRGTHAHSWIMAFDDEPAAFEAYAEAMPNNCVFLVDTYDTLRGVRLAIEAGRRLRERGHRMAGIRLDSGDLAYLSVEARRMLDEAGFKDAAILASNELDEHVIESLKQQGAAIAIWGVGTRLVTGHGDPALGGIYKLSAIRSPGGPWRHKIKLSEQAAKTSVPGILNVRRFSHDLFEGDMIYNEDSPPATGDPREIIDPGNPFRRKVFSPDAASEDLLVPILRSGLPVFESPGLPAIRERARAQLARLHPGIRRLMNPHEYPVGLEKSLHVLRAGLIEEASRQQPDRNGRG